MKKEVEVLWRLASGHRQSLAALARFGRPKIEITIDDYFYDPRRADLKPVKGRLTACFRLRRHGGGRAKLTYKTDHFRGREWLYSDEAETAVADASVAAEIIHRLGFKPLVRVAMEKRRFRAPGFEIILERVRGLGSFLEVEMMTTSGGVRIDAAKQRIRDLVSSLGIRVGEEVNSGKPELLLRARRRFEGKK